MGRSLQSHGRQSKVYVPVLRWIFKKYYRRGKQSIEFTMQDIREACDDLGIEAANPADVVYRMKSRTKIPPEIEELGFRILRPVARGKYLLEVGESTLIDYPDCDVEEIIDRTPAPVRRMLGVEFGDIDEQGLLSVIRYNDLISRFLGQRAFHFKGHVRKSVEGVGQAEVDDVHVSTPLDADEPITVVPVEAKAKDEPTNRAQIAMQILYARTSFPGHPVRPLTIKLFADGVILFMEFEDETNPRELRVIRSTRYRLVEPDRSSRE
ncbi:hypothetical protein [Roseisolibacter agri]|uniref:Uncharacterized protein n=1 Tax=Roseisolibacter agri TaxID=2014610 RepID=A0AA37Q4U0_9BACT|nr:hypothetical protein [Roseisolibacter agri]GLC26349.1 hypothetical protein rosag_28620 [Roseisolibacter agri]